MSAEVFRFADYEAKPKPHTEEYALAPIVNLFALAARKEKPDTDMPCENEK
jgi:hypothetical protein